MILDKILLTQLKPIGKSLLQKAKLNTYPKNIDDMSKFINTIKEEIEKESFDGLIIGNIFFNFVTSIDVRDRLTTSRIFEDIFCSLFGLEATDTETRTNPEVTNEIKELDKLCISEDWNISDDLSGNKREKSDVHIGNYNISLKTLKGKVYDKDGIIIDSSLNTEVNVGSLSFRALLKGILSDEKLSTLKDRKGGLGSKAQIRNNILNVVKETNKTDEFKQRLNLFINYVYEDDLYLVLKSHYKIIFYLIPKESFQKLIVLLYEKHEQSFESVWGRWENNNLRFQWPPILRYLNEFKLPYYEIDILLTQAIHNKKIIEFTNKITKAVADNLKEFSE